MVSGLNQQQNRNLQFGAQGAVSQNTSYIQNAQQAPYNQQGQNFGALTSKPDTFENSADPNFGAIDKQALEQGAQEITKTVEDSPFTQMLKNMFGIDIHNPKKTLISLGLTLTTVIGLAKLGNSKISTDTLPDLGIKVSEALKNNKTYMGITNKLKGAKDSVVKFLRKSKSINDLFETFATRKAKPVNPLAKGTGTGLKRIFSLTAPDTLETAFAKMTNPEDIQKLTSLKKLAQQGDGAAKASLQALQDKVDGPKLDSLRKIVGDSKAREMLDSLGGDSMDVSNKLLNFVGEHFGVMKDGVVTDEKGLQTILRQLKLGKITGLDGKLNIDVSEFTNITMNNNKGLMKLQGDWWPTNLINNIGRKIRGDKWKDICKGNLGDSLIKHSVISGKATSTKMGSFVQQSLLFPTEAISNFVNDKSGLGFFLCGMIMNLYNNVQDAPKDKKVATMADDFAGTIGSLAITMPLSCAVMYGAATLGNVKGDGLISKYLLKPVGKFFGAGLGQKYKYIQPSGSKFKDFFRKIPGRTVGFAGGFMRLALVMFALNGIFGKPVKSAINKVFGKPYDPAEEEALKNQQAQQAELMKNLNMTQEQAMAKLQAHPEFIEALQNDPQTLKAIEQNPALLLQLIAALPDTPGTGAQNTSQTVQSALQGNKFANSNVPPSQLLNKHLNAANAVQNQNPGMNNMAPPQANNPAVPVQQNMTNQTAAQNNAQLSQNSTAQNNAVQNEAPANKTDEPVRTYIPSSKPFNYVEGDTNTIKQEEITNANVQAMLSKADKAEQEAMKILG